MTIHKGACIIFVKLTLMVLLGFLWIFWLFSEAIMEKSEYLLIGVYLCVLGFAVPLTVVIVDFVVYEATFIDSFLAGSVIYLVIGLFSNFYIKKQYGKGFLPVNISDS